METLPVDFIDKLKQEQNKCIATLFNKKSVKLQQLTLKQQKNIISTAVEGVKGGLKFNLICNEIIKTNSDLPDVYIYDRLPIILALRVHSLGNEYSEDNKAYNIQECFDRIKSYNSNIEHEKTVTYENISLHLKVPTLTEESVFLQRSINELEKIDNNKPDDMFKSIYTYELLKFLVGINIGDVKVEFGSLSINDKVKVLDNLPLSLYNHLSAFFKQISNFETHILTFNDTTITIDASFFDTQS